MQQFIIEQIHHFFTWAARIDWNGVINTLFDWLKKAKIILDLIPFVMPHVVDPSPKGYRSHSGTPKRGRKRSSSYRQGKGMRKR
ncbi:hypothetical protein ASL14_26300 (plasmid) [Paenibacillus sp. IHB B 3084]|uniref:hypothetical protein n=1 Tax=Paenibacillus sp. IHB B 3084 TaxID=867076 RepID=UPI0007205730|nr:hypothetical protein [Paenibacillus sp. IHB B 3084]ALP39390.1 hypothetical protein ASL14_26300 [Paenibacillus sp. IHB B 3084]